VGKGDRRTRRGKIYAGSFGKSRPKDPKAGKAPVRKTASAVTSRPAVKTAAKAPRKAKA
jgi:30S ribosomal protein S31